MIQLHAYWRSSASYRVRIALNLKGVAHGIVPVNIVRGGIEDGGEQHGDDYRALNPQGLVPTLITDDGFAMNQSLTIFQWLEAHHPAPALVPSDEHLRLRMWSFCQYVASEIQPLHNLRVLRYMSTVLAVGDEAKATWLKHWITTGLASLEASLPAGDTAYCFGDTPSYADCCLVPQMFAAERFAADRSVCPRLVAITARARALPAFEAAQPSRQPDAVPG